MNNIAKRPLSELSIIDTSEIIIPNLAKIVKYNVLIPPLYLEQIKHTGVGIDPGSRNIGVAIAFANSDTADLFQCKITNKTDDVLQQLLDVRTVLDTVVPVHFASSPKIVVEGASYGNFGGRQTELAMCRASLALWFVDRGYQVEMIPPMKIRKIVFGSGKIKNPWSNVPDDCAAAFGAAALASV